MTVLQRWIIAVRGRSVRLNEDQCPTPASPQPPQHHPQQFVSSSKSRPRMLPFENAKLLPKSKVF